MFAALIATAGKEQDMKEQDETPSIEAESHSKGFLRKALSVASPKRSKTRIGHHWSEKKPKNKRFGGK